MWEEVKILKHVSVDSALVFIEVLQSTNYELKVENGKVFYKPLTNKN